MSDPLFSTVIDSPVGPITIVAGERGLRAILWPHDDPRRVPLADTIDDPNHPMVASAAAQLAGYFDGDRTEFDVPLDPVGTDFQRSAWDALRTIAYGTTVSYGEQAAADG